ncbi:MAG: hypothetical protein LBK02_10210 [Treponema sp.]|jgi:hypothetical protein|nr:hypothetical protein [Treponema sp.]
MLRNCFKIAFALLAAFAVLLFAACPSPEDPLPSGIYTPGPGGPGGAAGGASLSVGIADDAWKSDSYNANWGVWPNVTSDRILTFDDMPPVSYWNAKGHNHAYADPFHFANGNKVTGVKDWETRRQEISRIMQYYEYGIMPSMAPDVIDISYVNTGVATTAFTVRHIESGRTFSFTITGTLPTGAESLIGKRSLGLTAGFNVSTTHGIGYCNYSTGTFASESNGSGAVPTLYGLDFLDPSSPSANVSYAWGMSIIITALEWSPEEAGVETPEELPFRGYFAADKVGYTGYSRGGKAAECIAAFTEGRKGTRLSFVAIGSAGSGGPALERYITPAGYRPGGVWSDPLPLDSEGVQAFGSFVGKPWYLLKINDYRSATRDNVAYKAVRGFPPYNEPYTREEIAFNQIKVVQSNAWSGIQSLSEGRRETPGWFSVRFREFLDLHPNLDIDYVATGNPNGKWGIICTTPFDQHFLSLLIPPMGVHLNDGFRVPRNNIESQFANWVIMDEIYKMYAEEAEAGNQKLLAMVNGDPDLFIWRNTIKIYDQTHGPTAEAQDYGDVMKAQLEYYIPGSYPLSPTTDPASSKFRDPPFPVDDPISRFDYYRMDWGRPGHPTIAERVRKWIPTANGGSAASPRKAMDWRGLVDDPEPLN